MAEQSHVAMETDEEKANSGNTQKDQDDLNNLLDEDDAEHKGKEKISDPPVVEENPAPPPSGGGVVHDGTRVRISGATAIAVYLHGYGFDHCPRGFQNLTREKLVALVSGLSNLRVSNFGEVKTSHVESWKSHGISAEDVKETIPVMKSGIFTMPSIDWFSVLYRRFSDYFTIGIDDISFCGFRLCSRTDISKPISRAIITIIETTCSCRVDIVEITHSEYCASSAAFFLFNIHIKDGKWAYSPYGSATTSDSWFAKDSVTASECLKFGQTVSNMCKGKAVKYLDVSKFSLIAAFAMQFRFAYGDLSKLASLYAKSVAKNISHTKSDWLPSYPAHLSELNTRLGRIGMIDSKLNDQLYSGISDDNYWRNIYGIGTLKFLDNNMPLTPDIGQILAWAAKLPACTGVTLLRIPYSYWNVANDRLKFLRVLHDRGYRHFKMLAQFDVLYPYFYVLFSSLGMEGYNPIVHSEKRDGKEVVVHNLIFRLRDYTTEARRRLPSYLEAIFISRLHGAPNRNWPVPFITMARKEVINEESLAEDELKDFAV